MQSFRGLFSDVLEKFLLTRDMAEKALADHWELYQAIAARDGRRARELMSEHLDYFESKVKALTENGL